MFHSLINWKSPKVTMQFAALKSWMSVQRSCYCSRSLFSVTPLITSKSPAFKIFRKGSSIRCDPAFGFRTGTLRECRPKLPSCGFLQPQLLLSLYVSETDWMLLWSGFPGLCVLLYALGRSSSLFLRGRENLSQTRSCFCISKQSFYIFQKRK